MKERRIGLLLDKNNVNFLDSFIEAFDANGVYCVPMLIDSSNTFKHERKKLLAFLQSMALNEVVSINEYYHKGENLFDETIFEQAKINVWYVDTMQHGAYDPDRVLKYNTLCSFEPTDIPYAKRTYGLNIDYVPFGAGCSIFCDDTLPATVEDWDKRKYEYDVCFVGLVAKNSYRLDILNRIAKVCGERGYRFALYGHFWHSHHFLQKIIGAYKFKRKYPELYPFVYNQRLSPHQVAQLYKHSKVCLNIHNPYHTGLNCRSFEIMGNGNFLLTDKKNTSNLRIQRGIHYDEYETLDDLEYKLIDYIEDNKKRHTIALDGARITRAYYTIDTLIKPILEF